MNLAAHPDDEDGQTMAYYRHAQNAVTYSIIFTRGEGGQNEIGPELYQDLGALRTRETERAARILGTQVHYLNFYDFGFSKQASETFEEWGGKGQVIGRLVYMIRKLKPDVIFTNHDTVTVGQNRQHGHHQAVGIAAYSAFELAADSTYLPEHFLLPGVSPWQPKRLFLRHWREPEEFDVAVPVGDRDPEYGKTYQEIAMEALREHASQGMEMFARREWPPYTYFTLLRSATDAPMHAYDLAGNLTLRDHVQADLSYWIDSGRISSVPEANVSVSDSVLVPGESFTIRWNRDGMPPFDLEWRFTGAVDTTILVTEDTPFEIDLTLPRDAVPTIPASLWQYRRYQSNPPLSYALYRPDAGAIIAAGYFSTEIAPPISIDPIAEVVRLHPGENRLPLQARIYDQDASSAHFSLSIIDNDGHVIRQRQFLQEKDSNGFIRDTLTVDLPDELPAGTYSATINGVATPARPGALPARLIQTARVFQTNTIEGLRVGIIRSYDNSIEQALAEMGTEYVLLDSLSLAGGNFTDLYTIIVDIRAYLVRPDLRRHNDALLRWVRNGGNLVVTYQKTFEWNPEFDDPFAPGRKNPDGFSPYPLRLGRDRVTRADAPVTVLVPENPIFTTPNRISDETWNGWIQERGLYFPATYGEQYTELIEMADPDELPLRSSTLFARYGNGTYIYTALSLYRQLKALHPGAFALFANMISLPLAEVPPIETAGTP